MVHDVVRKDHGGEDRVAADEAGSEGVGRGSGVRRLHNLHTVHVTSREGEYGTHSYFTTQTQRVTLHKPEKHKLLVQTATVPEER